MTHVTTFYNTPINRNEVICVEYGFNVSYLIMLWLQKFRAVTQSDFKSLSYMTEFFKPSRLHGLPEAHRDTERIDGSNYSDAPSQARAHKL